MKVQPHLLKLEKFEEKVSMKTLNHLIAHIHTLMTFCTISNAHYGFILSVLRLWSFNKLTFLCCPSSFVKSNSNAWKRLLNVGPFCGEVRSSMLYCSPSAPYNTHRSFNSVSTWTDMNVRAPMNTIYTLCLIVLSSG